MDSSSTTLQYDDQSVEKCRLALPLDGKIAIIETPGAGRDPQDRIKRRDLEVVVRSADAPYPISYFLRRQWAAGLLKRGDCRLPHVDTDGIGIFRRRLARPCETTEPLQVARLRECDIDDVFVNGRRGLKPSLRQFANNLRCVPLAPMRSFGDDLLGLVCERLELVCGQRHVLVESIRAATKQETDRRGCAMRAALVDGPTRAFVCELGYFTEVKRVIGICENRLNDVLDATPICEQDSVSIAFNELSIGSQY